VRSAVFVLSFAALFGVGCSRCDRPHRRAILAAASGDGGRSEGCGKARRAARGEKHTVGGGRSFHVWTPASYDAGSAYPVVLTLHGWQGNGPAFEKWFEMEQYVEDSAIVVYPDAREGVWDFRGDADLDFTADVLDALAEQYCVDRTRVLAFGFSFGAKMAQHLACKRPDLVKAAAAGAGSWAEKTPKCVAPIPVLVVHRTRDDNESMSAARDAVNRWVAFDQCRRDSEPSPLGHGCVRYPACAAGSSVTFCEDTHYDASWPRTWNHTVREEYRRLVWQWFAGL
jgi:polyhydroxybutyrate depolymerase